MAESLKNANLLSGSTIWSPWRILSSHHRCCFLSSVGSSRLSEVFHTVYVIPFTKLRLPCLSSQSMVSSALVKSVGGNSVELGFIYNELEDNRVILKESQMSETKFAPLRDTEGRDVDSVSAAHRELGVSKSGIHFLEETDGEVLSQRILLLSRTNKVRSAFELYNSMELSGLYPNRHACNSLLSCLLRQGLLDDALGVFKTMLAKGATTGHSYSLILKGVAEVEGYHSSLKLFLELEKEGSDDIFDIVVYNTMISICGRIDDWMQCEKLWGSMKENGHKGTEITYSLLISIFVRCSQNELALQAYQEMVQGGLRPGSDVQQAVIRASVKEGKWEWALDVFDTMLGYDQRPNLVTCNALLNSIGKVGEVEQAFKFYGIMKSLGLEPDGFTLNALIGALYRADRPADALRLFDSILREKGFHPNLHHYNTALISCSKLGSWDRAIQYLWHMETSGLSIPAASYNLVISTCESARKPKVALQVYWHMINKQCNPDTFTYISIIRSCIWGSLWDEVEEILKVVPDVSLYNTAIQGMCLRGKTNLAKTLYRKMRDKGFEPDGKTRALMLQKLTRR
ncbi:hypothetical protein SAY86_003336 [Trapa natans]|uniref:Pentatricopeptide repeat-containing protein n=1 Tax=Trapa natans TaxID=22666 RepID=A0AAN7MDZ4_TRANT|nr:hypothetical protein SAY86_003336 [Trapa natans]